MTAGINEVLILSLFPSTNWWAQALNSRTTGLYTGATSQGARSYNRYQILTANGIQTLSVPLKGGSKQRATLGGLHIDYTHDWQRQHWGALYSAYGRAPFYEHYAPALQAIIYQRYDCLEALNRAALQWLNKELRLGLLFTDSLQAPEQEVDVQLLAYHQVFEDRHGFVACLSAVDLLMNEGPYGQAFLRVNSL